MFHEAAIIAKEMWCFYYVVMYSTQNKINEG